MTSNWTSMYAVNARFDYVKLRFFDTHPLYQSNVQQVIAAAFGEVCKSLSTERPKNPKWTILPPSQSRPNGYIIVEAFGVAAELVNHIPAGWMANLTYAHVKTFGYTRKGRGVEAIKTMYESARGPRSLSITYPGTKSRSDKGKDLPSIRSGSRKSGIHLIAYQRAGQAVGFEGRFRDEQVTNVTSDLLEMYTQRHLPDASVWAALRYQLARKAGECFERDFWARGQEPADWFIPGKYSGARPEVEEDEWIGRHYRLVTTDEGERDAF